MADFLNKADFIEHLSEYDREALKSSNQSIRRLRIRKQPWRSSRLPCRRFRQTSRQRKQSCRQKPTRLPPILRKYRLNLKKPDKRKPAAEETSGSVTSGGSINASADDITLMAALLDCEAIHDYEAMLAVATVIMNRVESPRFPNTIRGVIYAKGQFEPTWTGRLDAALRRGSQSLARQAATDAVNGKRLAAVANCYYFLYAPYTDRTGVTSETTSSSSAGNSI